MTRIEMNFSRARVCIFIHTKTRDMEDNPTSYLNSARMLVTSKIIHTINISTSHILDMEALEFKSFGGRTLSHLCNRMMERVCRFTIFA